MIILEISSLENGRLLGESGESFFLMLLFFNNVHNLKIFFFEVSAALGFFIDFFFHDLMFGKKEVGVEFCLLDKTLDCLIGSCIKWRFEGVDLFHDSTFELLFFLDVMMIELHPAK